MVVDGVVLLAGLKVLLIVGFLFVGSLPIGGLGLPLQEVVPVIVDMDVDPSDTGALLYLLKHPGVSVRAVTVSCGITYIDEGVANVLRLLAYLGIRDIPVAGGKVTPLAGDNAFPTSWRDGSFNFYGLDLPPTDLQPSELNASELIISVITSSAENVTLVPLGPLTNIAIALQADPSIRERITVIHCMGGAVTVPGNVGYEYPPIPNYAAEWNIWVDPLAADIVFTSGVPITLIPLDATNEVPKNEAFRTRLESEMRTPEAAIVYEFLRPGLGAYFWDQLAAVALTDPSVVTFEWHYIEVLVDGGNETGWTQSLVQDPPNTKVAVHANAQLFEDIFLAVLNYQEPYPAPLGLIVIAVAVGIGIVLCIIVIVYFRRREP
ncbi:MAG: nucleoside hydrolase [Candidatus Hodarchaeota archaeon]